MTNLTSADTTTETPALPVTLDEQIDVTQVPEPITVAPPPPAPVEVPEQTYTYQPTDDAGRTLGGKQVIKYRTTDELVEKLQNQAVLLQRRLRDVTRKQRLGIAEDEQIPDSAPRFDTPIEFAPRALGDDARVKLSRDLLDPDKFNEATDTLFEAAIGVKPLVLSQTLTTLQKDNLRLKARVEGDAFLSLTPAYYPCKENFEVMTDWMFKRGLAPVRDNYTLAYNTLKAAGLLLDAPIVREDVPVATPPIEAVTPVVPTPEPTATEQTPANSQPVQETPSRITTEEPAQVRRTAPMVATGLTRNHSTDAGPAPKRPFTLKEIDAMDSETYRRNLRNPQFVKLVQELEQEKSRRGRS